MMSRRGWKNKEMVRHELGSDKWYVRFTDEESDELVWNACSLNECFGLNRRIAKNKGVKPIGLEAWEIEALYEVYSNILEDHTAIGHQEYANKESPEYQAMLSLVIKLKMLYDEAFRDSYKGRV
jgi:hypothetical protein